MKKILLILGILLIIFLIVLLIIRDSKPVVYREVNLSSENYIRNRSSISYLDTIVSVGLSEMNITGCTVIIRDMPEELLNNRSLGSGDIDLEGAIFGSGNTYQIYINLPVGREKSIEIISHELIHLEQYRTEKLVVLKEFNDKVLWENKEFSVLQMEYMDRPWEIDAFKRGRNLSRKIEDILILKN